jgi:hypothetical protein
VAARRVISSVRAPGRCPSSLAHEVKDTSSSKLWTMCPRTTGTRPRPPAIRPSARNAPSAWRTVPRETPKRVESWASDGTGEPGGSVPSRICSRSAAAIAA